MIKSVKNEFFIYCKETRIESNRSFYGSFSLGPFDSGQSITIANALRRTLLSELKGLAITSAEIEGAFHEYSTLPGVRDSILDILLNLKDIVLKTENYGNKKRGTSYATTFKKTQIGYLKIRGPGVVTASELKLPPGIQCVDPEQYIATLSEEGILNIKLMINEGKNYVLQNSYSPNPNPNSNSYHSEKPLGRKKESFLGKELMGQNLAQRASFATASYTDGKKSESESESEAVNNQKTTQLLPVTGIVKSGYKSVKEIGGAAGFRTYINFKKRRLWLHKRNLFKTSPLFLGNSAITKNFFTNKSVKPSIAKQVQGIEGIKTLLVRTTKESFLCKQKAIKSGFQVPILTMVRKIRSSQKTTQLETHISPLLLMGATDRKEQKRARELQKKKNLFSFLLIKKGTLRAGVKGFFSEENTKKYCLSKDNLPTLALLKGTNYLSFIIPKVSHPLHQKSKDNQELLPHAKQPLLVKQGLASHVQNSRNSPYPFNKTGKELREGGAITATKAVSLVIDAVFMPVNKVNYIIETNEQSVMSSEKTSYNTLPSVARRGTTNGGFFGYGASKNKPLLIPIFTPVHGEQNVEKKLSLPEYFGFAHQREPFSLIVSSEEKLPLIEIEKSKEEQASYSGGELRKSDLYEDKACSPPSGKKYPNPNPNPSRKGKGKKFPIPPYGLLAVRRKRLLPPKVPPFGKGKPPFKKALLVKKAAVSRLKKKILFINGGFYFSSDYSKKKFLPLPFPIYKSEGVLSSLNHLNKNKSQYVSYFVRIGKRVTIERTYSSDGTSAFFIRKNILILRKKKNYGMSQQLRFLQSCVSTQTFLAFNKEPMTFGNESGFLRELKRKKTLPVSQLSEDRVSPQVPYTRSNKRRKKVFLKSAAAQKTKIIETQFNNSSNTNILDFSMPQSFVTPKGFPLAVLLRNRKQDHYGTSVQNPGKSLFRNKMRISDNQTKTPLKNNIILEIWTNGSIHPRQALYEACKNLLSLFSKLEKATPLAFSQRTSEVL